MLDELTTVYISKIVREKLKGTVRALLQSSFLKSTCSIAVGIFHFGIYFIFHLNLKIFIKSGGMKDD